MEIINFKINLDLSDKDKILVEAHFDLKTNEDLIIKNLKIISFSNCEINFA